MSEPKEKMHDPDCIFCAGETRRAHRVTAGRHAIELAEENRELKVQLAEAREAGAYQAKYLAKVEDIVQAVGPDMVEAVQNLRAAREEAGRLREALAARSIEDTGSPDRKFCHLCNRNVHGYVREKATGHKDDCLLKEAS